jgi:(p)ppGpp synthase/HD superfamily hydrolase
MTTSGYSDRIDHALAFAAKHHDQRVRRGTRAPYLTRPANVAVILTRYDRPEDEVVAGVLREVVADHVRAGATEEELAERIADKFGVEVLALLLPAVERRVDDEGVELSADERREDVLVRLAAAPDGARWVAAADALHGAATLLSELRRTVDADAVWSRTAGGHQAATRWPRRLSEALRESGFRAPVLDELTAVVAELEAAAPVRP